MRELWDNAMKAKQAEPIFDRKGEPTGIFTANFAASNQALHLLGKEIGMFAEKKEVPPREFANKSIEELTVIVLQKASKLAIILPSTLR
ncbi:MAG: hypothetical protein ABIW02_04415 [Nitrosospira sp.]|nr:hypothetical protein [Nitrosospira sp.]